MCPACFSNMALIAVSATSMGGAILIAARKLFAVIAATKDSGSQTQTSGEQDEPIQY